MAVAPAVERALSHSRSIECCGYKRSDGLWDIEAHLIDTKAFALTTPGRGQIEPGEALHRMTFRMTIDSEFLVYAVDLSMDKTPYLGCPSIVAAYQGLVGLRIGAGWTRKIRELFGGVKGCIHLVDLLTPMTNVAMQTVTDAHYRQHDVSENEQIFRGMVNSCHSLAAEGEVVAILWPELAVSSPVSE